MTKTGMFPQRSTDRHKVWLGDAYLRPVRAAQRSKLTFHPSDLGGSQEHIYLITKSFINDFAFIIEFPHEGI